MSTIPHDQRIYVSAGQSAIVYEVNGEKILKDYHQPADGHVERLAYKRLGSHPNIAKYLGRTEDGSILLEKGECLRQILQKSDASQISLQRKLTWFKDAAAGLQYVHDHGIIHADVGCGNMILTQKGLKLIDFAGCGIDNGEPSSSYEWFSYRPSEQGVSIQSDIFAFGCFIYETITHIPPYNKFKQFSDRITRVEKLYERDQFPSLTHVFLGELIQGCWENAFKTMTEVSQALEAFSTGFTEDELNYTHQRRSKMILTLQMSLLPALWKMTVKCKETIYTVLRRREN